MLSYKDSSSRHLIYHRALAALRAICFLCSRVRFSARALAHFFPPSLPSSTVPVSAEAALLKRTPFACSLEHQIRQGSLAPLYLCLVDRGKVSCLIWLVEQCEGRVLH